MTMEYSREFLIALIFMPLSAVVLIVILLCGAVKMYQCANNSGSDAGEEDWRVPRLTWDSRRHSPHLASEFVETSKTTSCVRTVDMADDISLVGDADLAGTSHPCPSVPSAGTPRPDSNFASQPHFDGGESNTRFAVEFYNQIRNQSIGPGQRNRLAFYERPTSEVFKLACCFGCCLWKRREGQLGDSDEPKLMNFDKTDQRAFVDITIPKQFLCEKPSISLSDLVRVQRANYRAILESTLQNPTSTYRSAQTNVSVHGGRGRAGPSEVPEPNPALKTATANIVNFSNLNDTVINIPHDNKNGNVMAELGTDVQASKGHFNQCEFPVLHETTSPINSNAHSVEIGTTSSSVVIHVPRTPVSDERSHLPNSVNVKKHGLYKSSQSISIDENLSNGTLQNSQYSSSSGVSVDIFETSFSSPACQRNISPREYANTLPVDLQRRKSKPSEANINLRTASLLSMRPTDLDQAEEILANSTEDLQQSWCSEDDDNDAVFDDKLSSPSQYRQQLPDLLPPQTRVQEEDKMENDSQSFLGNNSTATVDYVNRGNEHDCDELDSDAQMETKPIDQACHYANILGKTYENYWV